MSSPEKKLIFEQQVDAILTEITANAIWRNVISISEDYVPSPDDTMKRNVLEVNSTIRLLEH